MQQLLGGGHGCSSDGRSVHGTCSALSGPLTLLLLLSSPDQLPGAGRRRREHRHPRVAAHAPHTAVAGAGSLLWAVSLPPGPPLDTTSGYLHSLCRHACFLCSCHPWSPSLCQASEKPIRNVDFSAAHSDGLLFTCDEAGICKLWNATSGAEVAQLQPPAGG